MTLDLSRIKSDPVYFIEEVIGMKLVSYQKEWLDLARKHNRICFMAFRSSGKTRQLFVNYFIWNAITRDKTQYLIISRTLPQAIEILKDIRLTLLTNEFLKTCCPSNRSQSWSRTELELKNHSRILSKAYNENVRGLHVDGLGCDELGEYDNHDIFKKAVLPTIRAKRGFFVGTGTPKSELDLLHEIKNDPGFKSIHFDAYPAEGEKGNLFESRYPDTKIEHKAGAVHILDRHSGKIIDTYSNLTWSQEFLLKPVSMQDRLFPEFMIEKALDYTIPFQDSVINMRQYFMGIDFAMSANSGADYTVVTIIEKSPASKKLKVVLIERWAGLDYSVQKQRIKELAEKYQITKALGDENSFGKTFIYDLKREGMPIEGYKFTFQSGSKEEIIKALRDQFEQEGLIIPFSRQDAKTQTTIRVVIDELAKFGIVFDHKKGIVKFEGSGTHDDCVISLALANFIARHISMACFKVIKGTERKHNPFIVATR